VRRSLDRRSLTVLGPRLLALAAFLARRHGRTAVELLLKHGRAWLSDPSNDAKRTALVGQLRGWSERAGDTAGATASRLAAEIERRRPSVSGWERELMALRYEIVDLSPGPVREAALEAYEAQAWAGPSLLSGPARGAKTRRKVLTALAAEADMLRTERLSHEERRRATEAVEGAQAACYKRPGELPAGK
jgi:hypothetical protein